MKGKRFLITGDLATEPTDIQLRDFWNWCKANLNITPKTVNLSKTAITDGYQAAAFFDEGQLTIRKIGMRFNVEGSFLRPQNMQELKQQVIALGLAGLVHTFEDEIEF